MDFVLALGTVAVVAHGTGVVEQSGRGYDHVGTVDTGADEENFFSLSEGGFAGFESEGFVAAEQLGS